MSDYFIKVYKDCFFKLDILKESKEINAESGDCFHVTQREMFKWIEISKEKNIPICIFKGEAVCDLS